MNLSLGTASAGVLIAVSLVLGADKAGLLRRPVVRPAPIAAPVAAIPAPVPPAIPQVTEEPDVLAAGHGRDETFYACTACHSSAVVRRSNFTRTRWDDLLHWMTRVHGMPALEGADRALVLDYLAEHYGETAAEGQSRSPFLQPQRRNPFATN